jgi:hypothetical protein
MALVLANRVQESATANTTVSFTLTGAVTGFQTFAVIGNTNTTFYSATDTTGNWEVGLGTYSNGATGATQAAGPTTGSWTTNGSLVGSNIVWYSPSDTGYTAGDYVLLFDQTAGSSFFYYGEITLIQFAGGFGFAFHADIISSGGTPNGDPSSSWIMQESAGVTLTRTTVYASSNAGSAETFVDPVSVFVTYPSGRSVNLDSSGNVSALGTVASGTWQGSTIGVAYGGTGVTTSSGANSVVLRDANSNITVNRLSQGIQTITASGGTTVLTAASQFNQALVGTGGHTFQLPDATTLTDTTAFQFNNNATGTLTIINNASATVGTVASGGAANIALLSNATVAGTWDVHAYIPESVTWGTNALALGSTVISGGTWQGGTIQPAYGGTGLTTFAGANNALYSTGASTLTAGTLPILAGGTGQTTANTAFNALAPSQTSNSGKYLTTNGTDTSWATVGGGASITNDTTTATNVYPLFADVTTGTPSTIYTSNAKLLYKPSTGELQSTVIDSTNGIFVNSQTISADYTIASGDNGGSFGPVTVASGITVTVSSDSVWTVV